MALLPGERYVIQQIGDEVVLFEQGSERGIMRFDPSDGNSAARAQKAIHDSPDLSEEQKCFAHFWSGYFYAHAGGSLAPLGACPPLTLDGPVWIWEEEEAGRDQ